MKTAEELGIADWEFEKLLEVRDLFASGRVNHVREVDLDDDTPLEDSIIGDSFNMELASKRSDCGAVCCIGGWMHALQHGTKVDNKLVFDVKQARDYVWDSKDELHALFFPHEIGDWVAITPARAVKAINNFLRTGKAKWERAMR